MTDNLFIDNFLPNNRIFCIFVSNTFVKCDMHLIFISNYFCLFLSRALLIKFLIKQKMEVGISVLIYFNCYCCFSSKLAIHILYNFLRSRICVTSVNILMIFCSLSFLFLYNFQIRLT